MEGKARRPTASSTEKPSREGFAELQAPLGAWHPAVPAMAGFFLNTLHLHIALVLLTCARLQAGVDTAGASTKFARDTLYRYGEVVVSADRYPLSARSAGAVSFEATPTGSWQFEGPGGALASIRNLHLMGYGGGMALQTLSIRGMGSEHSLVLWNGMPAGNMQTGVSDFNLFNAADLEEIRVVPGGSSALYGSGAVGGVVNLVPRFPYSARRGVEFGARTGSFRDSRFMGRVTVRPDTALGISAHFGRSRSRGDFRFSDPGSGAVVARENSDAVSQSFSLAAGWNRPDRDRLGMMVTATSLDQGTPGPWSVNLAQSGARRNDRRYIGALSWESGPSGRWGIAATGMFDSQYERYLDVDGPNPADNFYRTTWAGASTQVRYQVAPVWLFQAGADLHHVAAAGNAMDGKRSREGAALSVAMSWAVSAGGLFAGTITPSIRWEGISRFDPHLSPKLGLNLERRGEVFSLRLHATAGSGRRDPTMNELHYSGEGGRGNRLLGPETSVSFDAGIGGRVGGQGGGIEWDVTRYLIRMHDRIQWLPTTNPRVWTPENIGTTRSEGWEAGVDWKPFPAELEFHVDYSTINAKKMELTSSGTTEYADRLIYIPLDKGSVYILLGRREILGWVRSVALRIEAIHTGERYILDDQSLSLPGHRTVNGSLATEFSLGGGGEMVLTYGAQNITDASYFVMPGYPMPGFSHSITIQYSIAI